MKFTQIRHGSHIIEYKEKRFLVDPVLADQGTSKALPKGRTKENNPLVPMPFGFEFLENIDAVLVTHMHLDHFDQTAAQLINKNMPIYCHPADAKKIAKLGFMNVTGIQDKVQIDDLIIESISGGKHGVGLAGTLMGRTTGYVFRDISNIQVEPVVYLIGDSIWCGAVKNTIQLYKPEVIIAYSGEARLPFGKPITMSTEDIHHLAVFAAEARLVVNHLDTWNHCFLTRDLLRSYLKNKPYEERIMVPEDGEHIELSLNQLLRH